LILGLESALIIYLENEAPDLEALAKKQDDLDDEKPI